MKKKLSILLAVAMLLALMAACVAEDSADPNTVTPNNGGEASGPLPSPSVAPEIEEDPEMELVNGNWRFKETRPITVVIFERNADVRTPAENNVYTDWIKSGVLETHNIEIVEFISIGRWDEADNLPLWLAGDDCPDVNLTYNFATIQEYANQGAVQDLAPIVDGYRSRLPNLWNMLGEQNMYGARNPETGEIFWLETMKMDGARINTFVREDWLNTLGIAIPTTTQQFEDMLIAFRDNAEKLMPGQADRVIPLSIGYDVGWRAENLFASFIPSTITQRDEYVYGYDDRHMLFPGYKEGVRLLNKWYNDGLVWKDFAIYTQSGAGPEDDLLKTGYVGAFIHNWDYPYRNSPSIQMTLQTEVGPDAAFIAIDPFQNDAGENFKYNGGSFDRKIFVPVKTTTGGGKEREGDAKAAMFYADYMSRPDVIQYLQLGQEGINYEVNSDGVPTAFESPKDANYIINSPQNIDYTITINGFYPAGITAMALASSYPGTAPKYISAAAEAAYNDGYAIPNLNLGEIVAESGQNNAAQSKRDALLSNAVIASVDNFDKVFDEGMADYMSTIGQAIIDERTEKYNAAFGADAD